MSDSSALQPALITLLQNNYLAVAILTAVGYDYVLTFSNEVEYIWSKPWTAVSTLFVLVRYVGFFSFALGALGEILYILNGWVFVLFLGAADAVMILRVWAMYNRSRLVLGALLFLYIPELISNILAAGIDSAPNQLLASTVQISDFSFCALQFAEPVWTNVAVILQVIQSAATCLLAVIQVIRESLQLYRATRQWRPNRYLRLLAKQGILTFFAFLLFELVGVLLPVTSVSTGWQAILLTVLQLVPVYTLTPRFVMGIRELYARNTQGGVEGIDTGFGLSVSRLGTTSMVFADPEQPERSQLVEEIRTEARTIETV